MIKSVVFRGSIVYAGPLIYNNYGTENFLKNTIVKLRKWFDGEVIVSTWKGEEEHLHGIDGIDKIVYTDDPGPGPVQHIKRQVLSYINGVKESSGDEILVSRTDISYDEDIFKYLNTLKQNDNSFKVFDERIITGNMMTIFPDNGTEEPSHFRVCDWFQLGNRNDILKWGDIYEMITDVKGICTEQIWSLSVLKKNYDDKININDISNINQYGWDYILNNFRILNMKSTLKSYNNNWSFQPEFLQCYLTEDMYNKKYIEKYKEFK